MGKSVQKYPCRLPKMRQEDDTGTGKDVCFKDGRQKKLDWNRVQRRTWYLAVLKVQISCHNVSVRTALNCLFSTKYIVVIDVIVFPRLLVV